jgi:transcription antitermination factor NusG
LAYRPVRDDPKTVRMAAACPDSAFSPISKANMHEIADGRSMAPSPHPWLALVVRSRHEKSVQTILDAKGYRTSVPLVRYIHKRRAGSAWDSQKPLIAGYVFAVHDRDNPFRIVTTPGVVKIVGFGGVPSAIPESEIEALERVAASGLPVAHCGYTRVGEKVELVDGPLKGVQGANLPAQPLGANDLIAVSVYDAPELTRNVRVGADGFIRLPMLKQRSRRRA